LSIKKNNIVSLFSQVYSQIFFFETTSIHVYDLSLGFPSKKKNKLIFRACLFPLKVEGKIEEGKIEVGLTFFPWFGTTLDRGRKGNDGWVPH
jgi:hypothetical protein